LPRNDPPRESAPTNVPRPEERKEEPPNFPERKKLVVPPNRQVGQRRVARASATPRPNVPSVAAFPANEWAPIFNAQDEFAAHWKAGGARYNEKINTVSMLTSHDMGIVEVNQPWSELKIDKTPKFPRPNTWFKLEIDINGARFPIVLSRRSSPAETVTIHFLNDDGRITATATKG